jgi:hypothetical protein
MSTLNRAHYRAKNFLKVFPCKSMRKRSLFASACAAAAVGLLLMTSSTASAQGGDVNEPTEATGWLIGPIAGMNLVSYSTNAFPMIEAEADCFMAQNGSGIAPFFGLTAAFPLGPTYQNFIVGEVIFDSRQGKFTAENEAAQRRTIITKKNGVEAEGSVETQASADLSYLIFNIAYKYNFTEGPSPVGPGLQVGPSIGMKMSSSITQDVTVRASSGDANSPQRTDATSVTDEITDAEGIRIALRAQATYDLPVTTLWVATPTLGYDLPITKVDKSREWSASGLFGGIAFRYLLK